MIKIEVGGNRRDLGEVVVEFKRSNGEELKGLYRRGRVDAIEEGIG
ncbi:hypothetical protein [Leuconostoc mesenteroides]|nr:hypothetical protein [Leuconostoc mesenteroides]